MQVKQAVTGYGGAHKPQVQEMVRRLLCLQSIPKPDDTADALALAITHGAGGGFAPCAVRCWQEGDKMIDSLHGKLIHTEPGLAVVECGGGGVCLPDFAEHPAALAGGWGKAYSLSPA